MDQKNVKFEHFSLNIFVTANSKTSPLSVLRTFKHFSPNHNNYFIEVGNLSLA